MINYLKEKLGFGKKEKTPETAPEGYGDIEILESLAAKDKRTRILRDEHVKDQMGKRFVLKAKVHDIGKLGSGYFMVHTVDQRNVFVFDEGYREELLTIQRGQTITIDGAFDGITYCFSMSFNNCRLVYDTDGEQSE